MLSYVSLQGVVHRLGAETLSVGTAQSLRVSTIFPTPRTSRSSAHTRHFLTSDIDSNAANSGGSIAALSSFHNRPPLHLHSTTDA